MKKKFKDAHAPVIKASKRLDDLRKEKKKVEKALREVRIERKQRESHEVDEKLTEAEEDLTQKKKVYREKAMKIYEKCRECESERLNLIRETSIHFIHAIHATQYSADQDAMYGKRLATIEAQQILGQIWIFGLKLIMSSIIQLNQHHPMSMKHHE